MMLCEDDEGSFGAVFFFCVEEGDEYAEGKSFISGSEGMVGAGVLGTGRDSDLHPMWNRAGTAPYKRA